MFSLPCSTDAGHCCVGWRRGQIHSHHPGSYWALGFQPGRMMVWSHRSCQLWSGWTSCEHHPNRGASCSSNSLLMRRKLWGTRSTQSSDANKFVFLTYNSHRHSRKIRIFDHFSWLWYLARHLWIHIYRKQTATKMKEKSNCNTCCDRHRTVTGMVIGGLQTSAHCHAFKLSVS